MLLLVSIIVVLGYEVTSF